MDEMQTEDEFYPHCPDCGDPIDYCQGHGDIEVDAIGSGA